MASCCSSSAARRQHTTITTNTTNAVFRYTRDKRPNHTHVAVVVGIALNGRTKKKEPGPIHPGTPPKDGASRPLSCAREREGERAQKARGQVVGQARPFISHINKQNPGLRTPHAASGRPLALQTEHSNSKRENSRSDGKF